MQFPNAAVTDAGYTTLVRAMRHEWEADELDDTARVQLTAIALGTLID